MLISESAFAGIATNAAFLLVIFLFFSAFNRRKAKAIPGRVYLSLAGALFLRVILLPQFLCDICIVEMLIFEFVFSLTAFLLFMGLFFVLIKLVHHVTGKR